MTLSRFLRDYLYIPLGGSRGGRLLTYRNLGLTMVLGGLWHGAAWTFVAWGALHGAGLVAEHAWAGRVRLPGWLRWAVTFHLVVVGWVVFRSEDLGLAAQFLQRCVTPGGAALVSLPMVLAILAAIGPQLLGERAAASVEGRLDVMRPAALAVALTAVILVAGAALSEQGVAPFIYFRF
jgi:D-alanyl-lipoteichoic acid acyltransferase DltB (MBOAT superfamily)